MTPSKTQPLNFRLRKKKKVKYTDIPILFPSLLGWGENQEWSRRDKILFSKWMILKSVKKVASQWPH